MNAKKRPPAPALAPAHYCTHAARTEEDHQQSAPLTISLKQPQAQSVFDTSVLFFPSKSNPNPKSYFSFGAMVWGLFPTDPLSGDDKYYIFKKGTFKVGRKGCDIIINKDKGVSRIHAEIIIDEMTPSSLSAATTANGSSKVRIRDCSKYGTFINKNLASQARVHESSNKEFTLKDGDIITFGTGVATYRFCNVPLNFLICRAEFSQADTVLQDSLLSIGASRTGCLDQGCTHVIVDENMQVNESLLDAIVAKKPLVLNSWVKFLAEKSIGNELPSYTSHVPTLAVEGMSVRVADPKTRETCLQGYTFVLQPIQTYKFRDRLRNLLDISGARILSIGEFLSSSQTLEYEDNNRAVYVVPEGPVDPHSSKLLSLYRVNEMNLIRALLSGQFDSSSLSSPPVVVSSSCSTDETVVADSDVEAETVVSGGAVSMAPLECNTIIENRENISSNVENDQAPSMGCLGENGNITVRRDKVDDHEGTLDIIYSQDLIVRNVKLPAAKSSETAVVNFKRFRKMNMASGNSFSNLVPFSKFPYKDSDYESEYVAESVREEKRRKQLEAIAEDLFNNEKGRKRGAAGSIRGILSRG